MIAWFVIAIATIGLFGYIAFAGIQTVSTTGEAVSRGEVVRRVDLAVKGIQDRMSPGTDGSLMPIMGSVASDGSFTLPADMSTLGATPSGRAMVYCPFGNMGTPSDSGGDATIRMPSGNSYVVSTRTVDGKTFVTTGRPSGYVGMSDFNLVGFIVAPILRESPKVGCDAITVSSDGKYLAVGSIVRPIYRESGVVAARGDGTEGLTMWVSETGTGSGLTMSDPDSLADALAYWRSHPVKNYKIVMLNGTYTMPVGSMSSSGSGWVSHPTSSRISLSSLSGNRDGVVVTIPSGGTLFSDVDYTLSSVTFSPTNIIQVNPNNSVRIVNSKIGRLYAYGDSNVSLLGNVEVTDPDAAQWMIVAETGAKIAIEGTLVMNYENGSRGIIANPSANIAVTGSTIVFQPKRASLTLNRGILTGVGSGEASISGSTISFAGFVDIGLVNGSGMSVISSRVLFNGGGNEGIRNTPGAKLEIQNSDVSGSNPVNYGVGDDRSKAISGGRSYTSDPTPNTRISARNTCWRQFYSGGLFSYSPAGDTTGQISSVSPDVSETDPNTTKGQIDAQDQNIERLGLRIKNQSQWLCTKI